MTTLPVLDIFCSLSLLCSLSVGLLSRFSLNITLSDMARRGGFRGRMKDVDFGDSFTAGNGPTTDEDPTATSLATDGEDNDDWTQGSFTAGDVAAADGDDDFIDESALTQDGLVQDWGEHTVGEGTMTHIQLTKGDVKRKRYESSDNPMGAWLPLRTTFLRGMQPSLSGVEHVGLHCSVIHAACQIMSVYRSIPFKRGLESQQTYKEVDDEIL
ncbi:hypothetical protein C8J56DRAFT_894345 [Mycena floridula]|nr:hypothetical protein C8J56DRAFT_894345 [Mycena floridula]